MLRIYRASLYILPSVKNKVKCSFLIIVTTGFKPLYLMGNFFKIVAIKILLINHNYNILEVFTTHQTDDCWLAVLIPIAYLSSQKLALSPLRESCNLVE